MTIPAGLLDDDPNIRPIVHIYVDSKAPWFDICDSLEAFPEATTGGFWKPHLEAFRESTEE